MKLGRAFSDSLIIEQKKASKLNRAEEPSWWLGYGRSLLFASVLVISFFVLVLRLFYLTIIEGHSLRLLSDNNRIRELVRHAPRGILLDRTGKPLVTNVPEYRLIKPCEGTGVSGCVVHLSQVEGEKLTKQGLPAGTFVEVDYSRRYLYPQALAHILGYTGELTTQELADSYYSLHNYRAGDRIGRMGAEAVFEDKLKGRDGRELVEINSAGQAVRTLGQDSEISGENMMLSVDSDLAATVAAAFPSGAKGAVIVSKPQTGEILSLYSGPTFDPNDFSLGMSPAQSQSLLTNPDQPLFDRAIGGVYPPGSTFKIVMALAGLEEGAVKPDTVVEDTGILTIGQFSFPNWYYSQYGKTEGPVDIVKAIQRSNDIFFYKAGEWLGISKIDDWARRVGLGRPLGIELAGEAGGLVPDPAWKGAHFTSPADLVARNNLWYLGDTYHVSIGQGYLLTTPLQMNFWTNIIASGGKLCRPTIKKVTSDKRQVISNCQDLGIKPETIKLITEGMQKACDTGGTGWPFFNFTISKSDQSDQSQKVRNATSSALPLTINQKPSTLHIPVACKTGTSEFGDPNNKTHAWFTVFGPLPKESVPDTGNQDIKSDQVITGDPEISVTVLVEGGGEGSNVAAPIAKKIFEYWFSR